jgi:hypothetical protein
VTDQDQDILQWYSRRGGVIRGPFTAENITRHLLLGRIRLEDELSTNKTTWTSVNCFSGMLPPEVINLTSWDDYQKLVEARMQVDERKSERRCTHCPNRRNCQPERRCNQDRRRGDDSVLVSKYLFNTSDRQSTRRPLLLTLLLATLMFVWLYPAQR